MLLIGMTGPIGHGKSTLAKALTAIEPNSEWLESSMIVAEVADAMHQALEYVPQEGSLDDINNWLKQLPSILEKVVHISAEFEKIAVDPEQLEQHPVEYEKLLLHIKNIIRNPRLTREKITRENKESYRPFLQWLGGYLVSRVDAGIWYKEIIRRAYAAQDKGRLLCVIGGLRYPTDAQLIRQAGGFIFKVYRPGHLQDDILDPTERERDNIRVDATIVSNGTIEELERCAHAVFQDAQHNELHRVYETADYKEPSAVAQPLAA